MCNYCTYCNKISMHKPGVQQYRCLPESENSTLISDLRADVAEMKVGMSESSSGFQTLAHSKIKSVVIGFPSYCHFSRWSGFMKSTLRVCLPCHRYSVATQAALAPFCPGQSVCSPLLGSSHGGQAQNTICG